MLERLSLIKCRSVKSKIEIKSKSNQVEIKKINYTLISTGYKDHQLQIKLQLCIKSQLLKEHKKSF